MARKDNAQADAPPLQKYRVVSLGTYAAGEVVTAADIYPKAVDQSEIDTHMRRLRTLGAITPEVEYATPEAPASEPESIKPIRVEKADHPEVASGTIEASGPADTFAVPSFRPVKVADAKS